MTRIDKIYVVLCLLFSLLIVVGNMTYQKFVILDLVFHKFEISVGAILYPLTFLISDLIAEFYGRARAMFCVRAALIMNVVAAVIISVMDMMTATHWSHLTSMEFHKVFGFYGVAFICSIFAAYVSQSVDVRLYLILKKLTNGKYIWIRNNVSTGLSLLIDTTTVISLMTLFGALPQDQMVKLILNSYSFKIIFTVLNTPTFYFCASMMRSLTKTKEGLAKQN